MLKKCLLPHPSLQVSSLRVSLPLLLLRIAMGTAFIMHGYPKIGKAFEWMGPNASVPPFLQALAALSEFGGGIALILGLLTPLASFGLICTMAVAVWFHLEKGDGMVGGYEMALVYLMISLLFLGAGPGRFSLDYLMLRKKKEENI